MWRGNSVVSWGQQQTIRSVDLSGEEGAFHFPQHAAKLLLALKTNNKILVGRTTELICLSN